MILMASIFMQLFFCEAVLDLKSKGSVNAIFLLGGLPDVINSVHSMNYKATLCMSPFPP